MKTLLSLLSATLVLSQAASGAISLIDSGGIAKTQTGAGTITVTAAEIGSFNANGSDKLVVSLSGERSGAGSYGHAGVTYGGQAMTLIEGNATDNAARFMSIWYLDNVSVTGDFIVDFTGDGSGIGFSAVALDGTATGFLDSSFSLGTSTSVTTTAADQFVFANGMTNGGSAPFPTADSPLTQLFSGDTGSSEGSAGYQFVTTASTVTPTFSLANGVTAVAFDAVPEPSAFALLAGCFGFTWVMLRRRA